MSLGWKQAHHAYSSGGTIYRASKLFKHLVEVVIPLADELDEPTKPPMKIPSPPEMKALGTTSDLALPLTNASDNQRNELKDECNRIIDQREAKGEGDR